MTLDENEDTSTIKIDEEANVDMSNAMELILEEAAESIDSFSQLEADLETAKADADEWRNRFLRKAAEFENYRKRIDKEKTELKTMAQSAILRSILPILDGFDRALKYFDETKSAAGSIEQYREGVELLCRHMLDTLSQAGVTPIETERKPFDPHLHEALSREGTSEAAEGTILNELRRGYMFKDTLLRPSQVIVAVNLNQHKGL